MLMGAGDDYLLRTVDQFWSEEPRHPVVANLWSGFVGRDLAVTRSEFEVAVVPATTSAGPAALPTRTLTFRVDTGLVCSGHDLREMFVILRREATEAEARAHVFPDPVLLQLRTGLDEQHCGAADMKLAGLFGGPPARIGVAENVLRALSVPDGTAETRIAVYPAGTIPAPVLPSPGE